MYCYCLQVITYDGGEEVELQYMQKTGMLYIWPKANDMSWESTDSILCILSPPKLTNNRAQYQFSDDDLALVKELAPKSSYLK